MLILGNTESKLDIHAFGLGVDNILITRLNVTPTTAQLLVKIIL